MEQKFCIVGIETNTCSKEIIIESSITIDKESINYSSIQILERSNGDSLEYDFLVEGKKLTLKLKNYPKVNTDYIIKIKDLISISGIVLVNGISRKIVFSSDIISNLEISKPYDFESIKDLNIEWINEAYKIVNEEKIIIDNYYIEISDTNTFFNIVKSTKVYGQKNIKIDELKDGQYYIRLRAEDDKDYSLWTDIKTFTIKNSEDDLDISDVYEDLTIDNSLKILSYPQDGSDISSFIFEFDGEIDSHSDIKIVVTRRDA